MNRPPRAWAVPGGRVLVVLGRAQRAWPVRPVVPVRRRASGGGAVLSGPWLLRAAVRLPQGHPLLDQGPGSAARWFGRIHADWLQREGVRDASLHEGAARDHWACFGGRGPGEVLVDGRKLVGIAQAWQRSAVLLSSGTLLAAPPWELLCDVMAQDRRAVAQLADTTISVGAYLGKPPDPLLSARNLRAALAAALSPHHDAARPAAHQENEGEPR